MKDVVSLQYVLKNKLDAGEIDKKVVFPTFREVCSMEMGVDIIFVISLNFTGAGVTTGRVKGP